MEKFSTVLRWLLKNNRLKDYEKMLRDALDRGYSIGTFHDFATNPDQKPYIILRHDMDKRDAGVLEMFRVEQRLNIKSSWYFRWPTVNDTIIKQLAEAGHEAGLHYETLADVCKNLNITKRSGITEEVIRQAQQQLKTEIEKFRKEFNVPCLTIASHGSGYNKIIQMSNNEIVSRDVYEDLGIVAESYDKELLAKTDAYVSDTVPYRKRGWKYSVTFPEAVQNVHGTIYFLSHPQHWFFSFKKRFVYVLKLMANRGS